MTHSSNCQLTHSINQVINRHIPLISWSSDTLHQTVHWQTPSINRMTHSITHLISWYTPSAIKTNWKTPKIDQIINWIPPINQLTTLYQLISQTTNTLHQSINQHTPSVSHSTDIHHPSFHHSTTGCTQNHSEIFAACSPHIFCIMHLYTFSQQWCSFLLVSSHKPIKIPKQWLFQPLSGPWSDWNSSGGLVSHCYYDAVERPAIVFSQISSVDKCIRTAVAPSFGWSKQPCIVHGQRALCFRGFIAEPKVDSWSETTYSNCSRTNCQWYELQLFMFCSHQQILFSVSLVSYCLCIIRTSCPIQLWSPEHLSR